MKTLLCILLLSALTLAQMADARKQDHGEHECKESPFPGVLLAPAADQTITGPHYLIFETGVESLKLFPGFLENHSAFAQGADFYTHADEQFRAPFINLYRSRGTRSSRAPLLYTGYELDAMGGLEFGGWDGSQYVQAAAAYATSDENWSPTNHGGHLSIYGIDVGSGLLSRQIAQFGGKGPNGEANRSIIFYRGLSFLGGQSGEPALNPTANPPALHVQKADGSGDAAFSAASIAVTTSHTPATAFEACDAGTIAWDANFVYVCVAPNTWRRSALAAW
jgi:hypothetical protein